MSEATAVMTSHEPFTLAPAVPPAQSPAVPQPLPYAPDGTYRPAVGTSAPPYQSIPPGAVAITHAGNLHSGEKRKRGRPRKYGPDGSISSAAAAMPSSSSAPLPMNSVPLPQNFSPPPTHVQTDGVGGSASPTAKKPRGRPLGSSNKKKQVEATGSTGIGFIPHVINVHAGEDVSSKIMAFSQNGPRAVCILSATGAISNVTLRQAATSGGTATYEGRFDILSLTGSFMLSQVAGQKSRTGGLSLTLAGPDGRVFGGCVAGMLIAANPVQVIVGSFLADSSKEPRSAHYMEPSSAPSKLNMGGGAAAGTSSSPSRGTFSESSGGPASPPNLSSGAYNNNHPQVMPWK